MKQINLDEAAGQPASLVVLASKGESFVIAKAGVPLARLVPLNNPPKEETRVRHDEGKDSG